MRSHQVLLFLCCFSVSGLWAQNQLGLRIENYSGVNSLGINPAATVNSPLTWDLNIAGGAVFLENNYAFLRNTQMVDAIRRANNVVVAPSLSPEPVPTNALALDFFRRDRRYGGYATAEIMGPAFSLHLEDQSFGIYTKLRAAAGMRRVPASFGYYALSEIAEREQLELTPFQAAGMVWGELGLNYGRAISDELSIGATLKILQGYEGAAIKNHDRTQLTSLGEDRVSVDQFDYTFAFASDYLMNDAPTLREILKPQGGGLGLDLGATYQNDQWKFGASLLDIGFVRFNQLSQFNQFEARDTFQVTASEINQVEGLFGAVEYLNGKVIARPHSSKQTEHMSLWLPAALSLQADYALNDNFFVNALMIRRVPTPGLGVKRGNLLAVTPRFESRWLGLMAPVALYDDRDLRLGLSMRMGPLTIGSDNLSGFFRQQEFSGGDIYAALKVNPFDMNLGGSGFKPRHKGFKPKRRGKRKEPKCYKPRR